MFKAFFFTVFVTAMGGIGYLQTQTSFHPLGKVLGEQTTESPGLFVPTPIDMPPAIEAPTPTVEPTETPTPTPIPTPTTVPTVIPTVTSTPTPTETPNISPTAVPTNTPAPTATATPTQRPTPTITITPTAMLSPTLSPTPTIAIPTVTSEQINGYINQYANEYSQDPNVIRHIALCESGFNPAAANLSYAGLFQFSAGTWSSYRNKMNKDPNPDLRVNAEEAVRTAAYVLSLNKGSIWPNCMP